MADDTETPLFPIFLKLAGVPCLVVGAGPVAARKAAALLQAGARVTVVAPERSPQMRVLCENQLTWVPRAFAESDLDQCRFAVAATDDTPLNRQVAAAAGARGIPVNVVDDAHLSSAFMPAIVRRGAVTVAFSSSGHAPALSRKLKMLLERVLPPSLEAIVRVAAHMRAEVKQRLGSVAARTAFWNQAFDDALLRGTGSETEISTRWRALMARCPSEPPGEVYLVGAGPGDPELLTLQALRFMERADVILYDRLVSDAILARCRTDAERIFVGKRKGHCAVVQEEIHDLMVRQARLGRRVLRLKGGDPFLFGRGGEEVQALERAGIHYHVAPGITAGLGCAAYAGIPLTHRDHAQACLFLTAHEARDVTGIDWAAAAKPHQTVVIYMGLSRIADIRDALLQHGLAPDTPAAVIAQGTTPAQQVIASGIAELPARVRAAALVSPALIIIGGVVRLAHAWNQPATRDHGSVGARPAQSSCAS